MEQYQVSLPAAVGVGMALGINFRVISPSMWKYALEVELEHSNYNPYAPLTAVTDHSLLKTGQIALAHLLEYPDYYVRLKRLEQEAELYWKGKSKPNILISRV